MNEPKWGIVSTVKAPLHDIVGFAAYHLRLGAHRIYLYLDEPKSTHFDALNAHPKLRVTQTDATYWKKRGGRPAKHQVRQTRNAADTYGKRVEVDWLLHIDHDEFLTCDMALPAQLAALDPACLCARIRPVEALAWIGAEDASRPFKSFPLAVPKRRAITQKLYPNYGAHLNGGFLSHVAGKMIYRTGIDGFSVKIHNAFLGDQQNPGQQELSKARLCHLHGENWQTWRASYEYRKSKGAYRAELKAPFKQDQGGLNMHALLNQIETQGGEKALRAFYEEVCTARPDLLRGLDTYGLLSWHSLDRQSAIAQHFPDFI